jgi:hypothetical protein
MAFLATAKWLIPSILSAGGQLAQNASARRQAERQMEFQKMMSDTAVQRGQKDLIASGLNPALGYGYQAGGSSGAQAQVGDVVGAGVSSALSARANAAQVDILQKQAQKAEADAATAMYGAREAEIKARPWMNADNNGINELWAEYTRKRIQADIETAPMAVNALRAQIQSQLYQNVGLGVQADFERQLGEIQRKGGLAAKFLNSALMVQKAFQQGIK